MMDPKSTRGFLNCNPGNMDRGEPPWNGEIRDLAHCANEVQKGELVHGRFCVFVDAPHGIRAMVKNLWAYHDRLGCRTIRDYINRWAPVSSAMSVRISATSTTRASSVPS